MDNDQNDEDVEKSDNQKLLEMYQQQIYKMEMEKSQLKRKLISLEQDYSSHVNELKNNICNLHADIKKQKDINKSQESSSQKKMLELASENEELKSKLDCKNLELSTMNKKMTSMHSELEAKREIIQRNLKTIEEFKNEIMMLKKENGELELKIAMIMEERDLLYQTLQESQERIQVLEETNKRHTDYITNQQNEIYNLEISAANLHEKLRNISLDGKIDNETRDQRSSNPTHSLMAELQNTECMTPGPVFNSLSDHLTCDDYEMDDEAFITYIKSNENNDQLSSNMLDTQIPDTTISSDENINSENFLGHLRLEVLDIFQQMRQMCVEISSKQTNNQSSNGYCTPDELAFVEMNFRLGSLRGVLSDLRSLLTELSVNDTSDNHSRITHLVNSTSIRDLKTCYEEQLSVAEKKANKLTKLNKILGESDNLTINMDSIPSTSSENPEEIINSIKYERELIEEQRITLQRELETYQNDLQELRTRIEQLSSVEANSSQMKLPDIDLVMTLSEFEDEKYECD